MINPGLCSISFRKLSAREIVDLCVEADIRHIEWGGDVHVPHGDTDTARTVKDICDEANISCPSYGSYYRAGADDAPDFNGIIDCAKILGCSIIRLWAGTKSPADTSEEFRQCIIADSLRVARMAKEAGMHISFEYHGGTLTETRESAAEFYSELPSELVKAHWQPPHHHTDDECLQSMNDLLERLAHIHVFHWGEKCFAERYLLEKGAARWAKFLKNANKTGLDICAFLEFSMDDEPANFLNDAKTLKKLIAEM